MGANLIDTRAFQGNKKDSAKDNWHTWPRQSQPESADQKCHQPNERARANSSVLRERVSRCGPGAAHLADAICVAVSQRDYGKSWLLVKQVWGYSWSLSPISNSPRAFAQARAGGNDRTRKDRPMPRRSLDVRPRSASDVPA